MSKQRVVHVSQKRLSESLTAANARIAELEARRVHVEAEYKRLFEEKLALLEAANARADAAERDLKQAHIDTKATAERWGRAESEAAALRAEVERRIASGAQLLADNGRLRAEVKRLTPRDPFEGVLDTSPEDEGIVSGLMAANMGAARPLGIRDFPASEYLFPRPEDEITRMHRVAIEKLQSMSPKELLELAKRAGVLTDDGELAPPYQVSAERGPA